MGLCSNKTLFTKIGSGLDRFGHGLQFANPDLQKVWTTQPALRHLCRCGCFLSLYFHFPHPSATPTPLTASSILLQVPPVHCVPAVSLHVTILHPGLHPFSTWESPTSPSRFSISPPWAFRVTPTPSCSPFLLHLPDLQQHQPFSPLPWDSILPCIFHFSCLSYLPSSVSCQSHPWRSSWPVSSLCAPPSRCGPSPPHGSLTSRRLMLPEAHLQLDLSRARDSGLPQTPHSKSHQLLLLGVSTPQLIGSLPASLDVRWHLRLDVFLEHPPKPLSHSHLSASSCSIPSSTLVLGHYLWFSKTPLPRCA